MTRRELESQLRSVHPYRERSRRRREASVRTKRAVRTVAGVIFGLGLVATLALVQSVTQDVPALTGGQEASWGRTHTGDGEATASRRRSSLFPSPKRQYNPHYDPRSRVAEQRRREMFWR